MMNKAIQFLLINISLFILVSCGNTDSSESNSNFVSIKTSLGKCSSSNAQRYESEDLIPNNFSGNIIKCRNGEIIVKGKYVNGKKDGEFKFVENNINYTFNFKNNILHGRQEILTEHEKINFNVEKSGLEGRIVYELFEKDASIFKIDAIINNDSIISNTCTDKDQNICSCSSFQHDVSNFLNSLTYYPFIRENRSLIFDILHGSFLSEDYWTSSQLYKINTFLSEGRLQSKLYLNDLKVDGSKSGNSTTNNSPNRKTNNSNKIVSNKTGGDETQSVLQKPSNNPFGNGGTGDNGNGFGNSGTGNGEMNDSRGNGGGTGIARILLQTPSIPQYEINYDCKISLKISLDDQGKATYVQVVKRETNCNSQTILKDVIERVKRSILYNKRLENAVDYAFYTITIEKR